MTVTTPPFLPTLNGLTWSRHKKPKFSTIVASHTSGREVRYANYQYPLYEFEAKYSGLWSGQLPNTNGPPPPPTSLSALGGQSLQALMGFFMQMQGQFSTFLYVDPDDNAVSQQGLGIGDGSTRTFQLVRTLGGFADPIGWLLQASTGGYPNPQIFVNGNQVNNDFISYQPPNNFEFASSNTPASGALITGNFSYAYNCRFLDDQMDFEEFMSQLYRLESMKFRSVKSWLGG